MLTQTATDGVEPGDCSTVIAWQGNLA